MKKKFTTKNLVLCGLFIALQIISTRFLAIEFADRRYSFSFLVTAATGAIVGPGLAALIGVISDLIGNTLFGKFAFFPGFTLNAALSGLIYGYFLHRENLSIKNILISGTVVTLFISVILTTTWVSMMTGNPFKVALITRIPSMTINYVMKMVVLPIVLPSLVKPCKRELDRIGATF